jgi:hypothetical protein
VPSLFAFYAFFAVSDPWLIALDFKAAYGRNQMSNIERRRARRSLEKGEALELNITG